MTSTDTNTPATGAARDMASGLVRMIEGHVLPRLLESPVLPGASSSRVPARAEPHGHALDHAQTCVASVRARHAWRPTDTGPEAAVSEMTRRALLPDASAVMDHVDQLAEAGFPASALFLDVLAPCARRLGTMWEDDEASFAEVTLGLGRLRAAFEILRLRDMPDPVPGAAARRELRAHFAPVPGERHTFGLAMVEHLFQQEGWITGSTPDATGQTLLDLVAQEHIDILGLTVTCANLLERLPALVKDVRRASSNPRLCVVLGGGLAGTVPDLAERCGADGAATDGASALELARRLAARTLVPV